MKGLSAEAYYDLLIEDGNDPFFDPPELREYMDKWDGASFLDLLKLTGRESVLEIGIGTGRLAKKVLPHCGTFTGMDISPKTIKRAAENLKNPEIMLLQGDFLKYRFDRKFDVIYSSLTFMHIGKKQEAFEKIHALLNEKGRFVLSVDKNQSPVINYGDVSIAVFPDEPENTEKFMKNSGFRHIERRETEFAHIFSAEK